MTLLEQIGSQFHEILISYFSLTIFQILKFEGVLKIEFDNSEYFVNILYYSLISLSSVTHIFIRNIFMVDLKFLTSILRVFTVFPAFHKHRFVLL